MTTPTPTITAIRRRRRRPAKQKEQLAQLNDAKGRRARNYAYHLSPYLDKWQAEGLTQRQITERLNAAGAVVPSEYDKERREKGIAPEPIKQWSATTLQRLLKHAADVKERMAWWAKRHGKAHTRPYGDGKGLFANPDAVNGLDDVAPNKPRPGPREPRWTSFPPEDVPELKRLWAVYYPLAVADDELEEQVLADTVCGRDAHCCTPPAQIRASAIHALGSHLGCLTSKRCAGQG